MKNSIKVLAFVLALSLPSPVAVAADPPLASCLSFRGETSSISSYAISISIPVYQKCGKLNHWGDFALITIDGDDGLLGAAKCDSFLLAQGSASLGEVYSGTIRCTIVVSGWQASKRVGQTSSTVRIKYVWDNSSTSTTVRHPAIPGASSSGNGSSSSGSGSSSSSTPSCSKAPNLPDLSITWNEIGPLFQFKPSSDGDKATVLSWNYALYDTSKSAWDDWANWNTVIPATAGQYQARAQINKSKIAFAVYSTNSCGSSEQARELLAHTGVPLAPQVQDELTFTFRESRRLEVGDEIDIYGIVTSKLMLPLSAQSNSSSICEVSTTGKVSLLAIGECSLQFNSKSFQQNIGATGKVFTLIVKPKRFNQLIPNLDLNSSYDVTKSPLTLNLVTNQNLPVKFTANSDEVCFISGDNLLLKKRGECQLTATQEGDENTLSAESRIFIIQVTQRKTTISCQKGKQTKKVIGYEPKCPAGYKKK